MYRQSIFPDVFSIELSHVTEVWASARARAESMDHGSNEAREEIMKVLGLPGLPDCRTPDLGMGN